MTKKRKKELSRVRSFIRRAEKRGYVFDEQFKKDLTSKTTRALQYLTPRKLYEKASYQIGSQLVSGMRGRQIERERAAIKGVATKQAKREAAKEYKELPVLNDLVYQNVIDLIDSYPSSNGAEYLNNLLKTEINTYGLDRVIEGMNAVEEDIVKRAAEILYYEGDSMRIHDALVSFSDIIRAGVKMTKEESKTISNVLNSL